MGQSIIIQALHQPITSLLSVLIIAVFALIHNRHAGYADVGMSYDRIVTDHELWRALSSQISHVEILHLVFNLSALWSIGIAEQVLGPLYYLKQTALLFILSPLICIGLYHLAIKYGHRDHYRSVTAVGYSCVLFGWMTVMAVRRPGGITMLPLFGAANIPMWASPFASLLLTSLLIPKASFVGHLAGILAGYLISIPLPVLNHVFDYIPAWGAIVGLVLCVVAAGGQWYSQHHHSNTSSTASALYESYALRIPLLGKYFSGTDSGTGGGDVERGGGGVGRLLGT